jgi:hydrogenase expression/formation protein HypD
VNFNDPALGRALVEDIRDLADTAGHVRIMEVCGTHTMAIGRFGIRRLLPESVELISGPGCPVCVTPGEYIDNAVHIGRKHRATIATFGDMIRVPGLKTSLEQARAEGVNITVITTPLEVLSIPGPVLFLAVGFETTIAPIAAAVKAVLDSDRTDIHFYTSLKLVPPTLKILLADEDIGIDAFLLPGHVSSIIGADAYDFIDVPSCIAGFEMLDILQSIKHIVEMKTKGQGSAVNAYSRVVTAHGNRKALSLIRDFFEPCDELWRGIGALPGCSLRLKSEHAAVDAEKHYGLDPLAEGRMPSGCSCGDVLKGIVTPPQCPLFNGACTPDTPVGPCMVSAEGSCAAYYRYER